MMLTDSEDVFSDTIFRRSKRSTGAKGVPGSDGISDKLYRDHIGIQPFRHESLSRVAQFIYGGRAYCNKKR